MKLLTVALALTCPALKAAVLVIDDFSHSVEEHSSSSDSLGSVRETSDDSIFGGYRRSLANGYLRFRIIDDDLVAGDSSGFASVHVDGGFLHLTKTALTGTAYVSYMGRAFTPGDRIGALGLDISGSASSLAEPILLLEHLATASDQIVSLSLSSASNASSFDIPIIAGTTSTVFDLRELIPVGGYSDGVDFSSIEDIGLGIVNGDPVGSVSISRFSFIPEPSVPILFAPGFLAVAFHRRLRS